MISRVKRLTQINADGTVVNFVRHFVLSERFVVGKGREDEEERRKNVGFQERKFSHIDFERALKE